MVMKLLIVEDQTELNNAIKKGFESQGFVVDQAFDGQEGYEKAFVNGYDCLILDLNLPKKDGIDLGRDIRGENSKVPIIALTARDGLTDKIKGFDSGFDDYLTKPFEFSELVVRVQALIRRSKPVRQTILSVQDIKLNPTTRVVKKGPKNIELTKIEFNILEYLLRKKGIVVTNEELIEHIWGEDADLLSPPIRSHIKNLRKKIKDENFSLIKTLPGVGYKISGD
jgi:DNA-binding response OmpR family regulator